MRWSQCQTDFIKHNNKTTSRIKHEKSPAAKNHKAKQGTNNTRTLASERSVSIAGGGLFDFTVVNLHWKFKCCKNIKWASARQNQQNGMSAQRRLRSACAYVQSDQSSLSAWRKLGSLATHWEYREDTDQTGRMPRLIWVFGGHICHFVGFCHAQAQMTIRFAWVSLPQTVNHHRKTW